MWEVIKNQGWLGGMAEEGSKAELGVPGSTPGGWEGELYKLFL